MMILRLIYNALHLSFNLPSAPHFWFNSGFQTKQASLSTNLAPDRKPLTLLLAHTFSLKFDVRVMIVSSFTLISRLTESRESSLSDSIASLYSKLGTFQSRAIGAKSECTNSGGRIWEKKKRICLGGSCDGQVRNLLQFQWIQLDFITFMHFSYNYPSISEVSTKNIDIQIIPVEFQRCVIVRTEWCRCLCRIGFV